MGAPLHSSPMPTWGSFCQVGGGKQPNSLSRVRGHGGGTPGGLHTHTHTHAHIHTLTHWGGSLPPPPPAGPSCPRCGRLSAPVPRQFAERGGGGGGLSAPRLGRPWGERGSDRTGWGGWGAGQNAAHTWGLCRRRRAPPGGAARGIGAAGPRLPTPPLAPASVRAGLPPKRGRGSGTAPPPHGEPAPADTPPQSVRFSQRDTRGGDASLGGNGGSAGSRGLALGDAAAPERRGVRAGGKRGQRANSAPRPHQRRAGGEPGRDPAERGAERGAAGSDGRRRRSSSAALPPKPRPGAHPARRSRPRLRSARGAKSRISPGPIRTTPRSPSTVWCPQRPVPPASDPLMPPAPIPPFPLHAPPALPSPNTASTCGGLLPARCPPRFPAHLRRRRPGRAAAVPPAPSRYIARPAPALRMCEGGRQLPRPAPAPRCPSAAPRPRRPPRPGGHPTVTAARAPRGPPASVPPVKATRGSGGRGVSLHRHRLISLRPPPPFPRTYPRRPASPSRAARLPQVLPMPGASTRRARRAPCEARPRGGAAASRPPMAARLAAATCSGGGM